MKCVEKKEDAFWKIHMKLTKVRKETAQIKTLAEKKQVIHLPWKREWDGAKKINKQQPILHVYHYNETEKR